MKDLTKYFIDLSKLSEEQRKSLPIILRKAGESIYWKSEKLLNSGSLIDEDGDSCYVLLAKSSENDWVAYVESGCDDKTELTYPEFIKLFEGGEEIRTELIPDVAYWRYRCLLAEKCLSVSPCDPDITEEQIKARKDYNQYLETFGKKS